MQKMHLSTMQRPQKMHFTPAKHHDSITSICNQQIARPSMQITDYRYFAPKIPSGDGGTPSKLKIKPFLA
jgi:hypothetical protein